MRMTLNKKITLLFLVMLILTVAISALWNYHSTRLSIMEAEKDQAESCTSLVNSALNQFGNSLEGVNRQSAEYRGFRQSIRGLCLGFRQDILIIYTIDPQTQERRLVLAVSSDPDLDGALKEQEGEVLPDAELDEAEMALLSGEDPVLRMDEGLQSDRVFSWLSMWTGSGSKSHCFILMQYSASMENGRILRDFLEDILLPVCTMSLAFLILLLLVNRRITVPIRHISDRMKRFAGDSRRKPEPLSIRSKDEIGEIASSFEKMTEDISTYIGNIEKLTQERVENDVQLTVARKIQNGLVPEKAELAGEGFRISAITRPAKGVGGDFYDCFRRDDGNVCLIMGDVSGKGISGAIFMAMVKTIIREKLMADLSPAETLNQTNRVLIDQNPEGLFATVFTAILDPLSGVLRYANAGHTPPILLGNDVVILRPESGCPVGLFDDAEFADEQMTLAPGQGLFLYTDGVTDAINPQHVLFGMNRLTETLEKEPFAADQTDETLDRLLRALDDYREGVEPFDDTAAMILGVTDAPGGEELQPVPVSLDTFAEIKKAVFALCGDNEETRMALLACDETLANIVQYSGATELAFGCGKQGDSLRVTFRDNGIAFDPTAAAADEKEFEDLDSGGMGLRLIRQTASSVRYERKDGKNLLELVFPVSKS